MFECCREREKERGGNVVVFFCLRNSIAKTNGCVYWKIKAHWDFFFGAKPKPKQTKTKMSNGKRRKTCTHDSTCLCSSDQKTKKNSLAPAVELPATAGGAEEENEDGNVTTQWKENDPELMHLKTHASEEEWRAQNALYAAKVPTIKTELLKGLLNGKRYEFQRKKDEEERKRRSGEEEEDGDSKMEDASASSSSSGCIIHGATAQKQALLVKILHAANADVGKSHEPFCATVKAREALFGHKRFATVERQMLTWIKLGSSIEPVVMDRQLQLVPLHRIADKDNPLVQLKVRLWRFESSSTCPLYLCINRTETGTLSYKFLFCECEH
jgi:hypothetical protein